MFDFNRKNSIRNIKHLIYINNYVKKQIIFKIKLKTNKKITKKGLKM